MKFNSEYGQAQVSSFCLARVGGVSSQQLNRLTLRETVQYIHLALTAESSMRDLAPLIEDALYRLVPRVTQDDALRRSILLVKRNVHNLRFWPEADKDISTVLNALSDVVERAQLENWLRSAREREDALSEARVKYIQELEEASAALAGSIEDPTLRSGLALASATLSADLDRAATNTELKGWRPTSKLARSSLAYLTRAALKTSPFSTFTQLAVTDFAEDKEGNATHRGGNAEELHSPAQTGNSLKLLQAIPLSLLILLAHDRELAAALSYELNAGLHLSSDGSGVGRVLKSKYSMEGGFAWRHERTTTGRFNPHTILPLYQLLRQEKRISYPALINLLIGIKSCSDPHQVVCQLLDTQFIRPVAPYSRLEQRPLLALARSLESLDSQRAAHVAEQMRFIEQQVEASRTEHGGARLAYIESIRRTALCLFEELNGTAPSWLKSANLIYEDVGFGGTPPTLSLEVQRDLMKAAEMLRPRLVRTQIYDYLYRHFVETFGLEGECDDILGFLEGFLDEKDVSELFVRAIAEDELDIKEPGGSSRSKLPTGESSISPAITLFFQLAAESQEAIDMGDYKLVVNQANSGAGGLLSRFCDLLGTAQGDLPGRLKSWLDAVYGEKEVIEMPVVAEWSSLQSARGLTQRVLQWPAEMPTTESDPQATLTLHDLRLRLNPDDATFYLVDEQDQIVAPSYLGVVPTHLIGSALRLFLLLLDPWSSDYAVGWHVGRLYKDTFKSSEVEFFPRQEQGRIVIRRARWCCPVERVPRQHKGELDFDFFVRMQRWRVEHNLSEEVFAAAERGEVSLESKNRKPIWIHFSSPHTLELLRQLVDTDTPAITLTEVLPTRSEHWISAPAPVGHAAESPANHIATDRRASEFMCLVRWPMPKLAASLKPVVKTSVDEAGRLKHRADDWLCFNIYPANFDQLDNLVRHLIHPIRDLARDNHEFRGWFFLRYIDERGPHIRLRLRGSARMQRTLRTEICALIERILPGLPPGQNRRHVLTSHYPPIPNALSPGYTIEQYQPERIKYGGLAGVKIAERLFEVSSEIALRAIDLESETGLNLLLLAAALMELMVSKTHPESKHRERFLKRYLWYWSGQNRPGADALRFDLEQEITGRPGDVSTGIAEWPGNPAVRRLIEDYSEGVDRTLHSLNAIKHITGQGPQVSFDYIHMNNNRFGVLPIEEAYLAALLLAAGESTPSTQIVNRNTTYASPVTRS